METRFKWPFSVLVAVPVMLVAHAVPCKPLAQSEHPSTTQNAAGHPSNEHDDWARAPKILQAANSWHTGDPLPPELRRLRKSEMGEPGPMDSSTLIAQVSNLPLLAALVVDPSADPECREDALSQGIQVGGPNRFFDLLRSQLSTAAAKNIQHWVKEVHDRISRPHAVVDALFLVMRICLASRLLLYSLGLRTICDGACHGPKYISSTRRNSATRLETPPKSGFTDLLSFFRIQRWAAAICLKALYLNGRGRLYRAV